MVRLQIGQEKVKESVEVERQKLQELADEVRTSLLDLSKGAVEIILPSALNVACGLMTRQACLPGSH